MRRAEGPRDGSRSRPSPARPLRRRPEGRRQPRDRDRHRLRRVEGDRRRADRPLRHDRDRLRGDERQRRRLHRRGADRTRRLPRRRAVGPGDPRRDRAAASPAAPPTPASRSPAASSPSCRRSSRATRRPTASTSSARASAPSPWTRWSPARPAGPGDAVIGLPSSGIHSNGYTLARRALLEDSGWSLDDRPPELAGDSVADVLLEPTVIYVRAALDLLRSDIDVRALAHITGGGVMNLLRFPGDAGWSIDAPLPPQPVFAAIAGAADVPPAEMYDVFNMGCGFVAVVPDADADAAVELLARPPPRHRPHRHDHRPPRPRRAPLTRPRGHRRARRPPRPADRAVGRDGVAGPLLLVGAVRRRRAEGLGVHLGSLSPAPSASGRSRYAGSFSPSGAGVNSSCCACSAASRGGLALLAQLVALMLEAIRLSLQVVRQLLVVAHAPSSTHDEPKAQSSDRATVAG